MANNKQNIVFTEYDVKLDGVSGGYTKQDTTAVTLGLSYREVSDTAQFVGITALNKSGAAPTVNVEFYETKFPHLFNTIAGPQVYPIIDGAKLAWGLGSRSLDMFDSSVELILHPVGVDADDFSNDIMFWQAVPDLSQVQIMGKRDGARSIVVPFRILPNEDVSADLTYGLFGDHSAVESAPKHVFITTERLSRAPHKHQSAMTMTSSRVVKVYSHAAYYDLSTNTGALNEAGDITATTATFNVDGIADATTWSVGDYFDIGTEVIQLTAKTAVSATEIEGTFTRGMFGTTQAIAVDDAVITKLSNVYVIPVSRRSTWASSSTGDLTVGDSNASENKGMMTWVADGSSNVTATVLAVASPNLVVTTTT
jgi:hypothetical protein